jgi:16S rRNA processing protein RimM
LNSISTSAWFPIARLLRPQGRRGELLAEPLSDLPGLFAANRELLLAPANSTTPPPNALPVHIEEHWLPTGKNAGRVVLKLSGCDSISAAEALAGQQLFIATDQLPPLDPGTFFVGDLLGCTLYDAASPNTPAGTVTDVEFATGPDGRTRLEDAAPLLSIEQTPGADPILVPLVLAWIDTIDIAARRIVMHIPEGLLTPQEGLAPSEDPAPDSED